MDNVEMKETPEMKSEHSQSSEQIKPSRHLSVDQRDVSKPEPSGEKSENSSDVTTSPPRSVFAPTKTVNPFSKVTETKEGDGQKKNDSDRPDPLLYWLLDD